MSPESEPKTKAAAADKRAVRPCRACGADVAAGAARCDTCGAPQGDTKCPHCGAIANASPDPELYLRCDVCGAPRVPFVPGGGRKAGKEVPHLVRAEAARRARAGWRAATGFAGAALPAVLLLAIVTGLAFSAAAGAILALVLGVPAASLFALAASRARARGKEIKPALDAAWISVATEIAAHSKEPLSPERLAERLGIAPAQAEELLALLQVNDVVSGDVTDAGDVAYRSRVRVDDADEAAEAAAEAESEALAEEAGAAASPKTMLSASGEDPAGGKRS